MRHGACFSTLLAALATFSQAAAGDPACRERLLIDSEGGAGRVDACRLQQALEQANLRQRLVPCVEQLLRQPRRVFGGLRFSFHLGESGAAADLRLEPSAFDHTTLPSCLAREFRRFFLPAARAKRRRSASQAGFSYPSTGRAISASNYRRRCSRRQIRLLPCPEDFPSCPTVTRPNAGSGTAAA